MSEPSLVDQCSNVLPGHGSRKPIAATLREIADAMGGTEFQDSYGSGEHIESFESDIAEMFDKEAAVFMPSGTMAQQIALRIWCERANNFTLAMHPSSHLEFAEQLGYQFLHNMHRLQFGVPEFLSERLLLPQDLKDLGSRPGALLLELPCRPLGGQLHPWEDLVAFSKWAGQNKVAMHLDGARIWTCTHYYQKSLAEIAALFDSVYVSFYKDLGGLSGCMLLGPTDFIRESRTWQRRYGGNLYTQAPLVASARVGIDQRLGQMDNWVKRAGEIASILTRIENITINPDPPHVNMFRIYLKGEPDELIERHDMLARETGTFLFHSFMPAPIPGFAMSEMHIWENALNFDLTKLGPFVNELVSG